MIDFGVVLSLLSEKQVECLNLRAEAAELRSRVEVADGRIRDLETQLPRDTVDAAE